MDGSKPLFDSRDFFLRVADLIPQLELCVTVLGLEPCKAGDFSIKSRFLDDERVAGGDGFDFGVGESRAVNVLEAAEVVFAGHHLGDELCLGLQRLPEVGVE